MMDLITSEVESAGGQSDRTLLFVVMAVGVLVIILIILVIYLILKKGEVKQVQAGKYGPTLSRSDSEGRDGNRPSVQRPIKQQVNDNESHRSQ